MGRLPFRTIPFISGIELQATEINNVNCMNLDKRLRRKWRGIACYVGIEYGFKCSNHDLFSRKPVDIHGCPGLLTYAIEIRIDCISAITVAGTVLELNELPCDKYVSNISVKLIELNP